MNTVSPTARPLVFAVDLGPPTAQALADEHQRIRVQNEVAWNRLRDHLRWALLLPCVAAATIWVGCRPLLLDAGFWVAGAEDWLAVSTVSALSAGVIWALILNGLALHRLRREAQAVSILPAEEAFELSVWRDKHPVVARYLHEVAIEQLRPLLRGEFEAIVQWVVRAQWHRELKDSLSPSKVTSGEFTQRAASESLPSKQTITP